MIRLVLALVTLALVACSNVNKLDSPAARNLVCERVALLSPKADCTPELSGVGDLATHTARVTLAAQGSAAPATVVCGLNAGQLSMACGALEVQPAQKHEAPKPQPNAPDAKATK